MHLFVEISDDSNSIEDIKDDENPQNNFLLFHEETHLELFYIASFLLLLFLTYHIVKRNIEHSRRKAKILQELQRQQTTNRLDNNASPTIGVLRQISLH